jgi:hypothetical protein
VSPNFVRSLGWSLGHHEEIRNGPEIKNHIYESGFRVSRKVRDFSVLYQKVLEVSGGSTDGAHMGPGGGALAYMGQVHQPSLAHAASAGETLKGRHREGNWGGGKRVSFPPLAATPTWRGAKLAAPLPWPLYKERGGQGATYLKPWPPPLPLFLLSLPQLLGEALSKFHHNHHHVVVLLESISSTTPSRLLDQGEGVVIKPYVCTSRRCRSLRC